MNVIEIMKQNYKKGVLVLVDENEDIRELNEGDVLKLEKEYYKLEYENKTEPLSLCNKCELSKKHGCLKECFIMLPNTAYFKELSKYEILFVGIGDEDENT